MDMKHYKDAQGNVLGFAADGSQDSVKPAGLVEISKIEAESLIKLKEEQEFNEQNYYRKRIYSYPPLGDFVDAWVKGDESALEEYRAACLEVKAKYPKPEGF